MAELHTCRTARKFPRLTWRVQRHFDWASNGVVENKGPQCLFVARMTPRIGLISISPPNVAPPSLEALNRTPRLFNPLSIASPTIMDRSITSAALLGSNSHRWHLGFLGQITICPPSVLQTSGVPLASTVNFSLYKKRPCPATLFSLTLDPPHYLTHARL